MKKQNGYWTYERCYEEAQKYKLKAELKKYSNGAYHSARKNDWLKDYTWLATLNNPYTNNIDNVYAYFFTELNAVYVGRTIDTSRRNIEHHSKGTIFNFAKANNIVVPLMTILESNISLEEGREKEDFYVQKYKNDGWNVINKGKTGKGIGSIGVLSHKWTYDACYQEALKYETKREFELQNGSVYKISRKKGWFNDYTWLKGRKQNYWTYNKCLDEAQKYKTRKEFFDNCPVGSQISEKNGWLKNFTWLKKERRMNFWNYDTCYQEALKYKTITDFQRGCSTAYKHARINGWLKDYTWIVSKRQQSA